jgi:outer membrane receptor for ferrienterochelin and colicins
MAHRSRRALFGASLGVLWFVAGHAFAQTTPVAPTQSSATPETDIVVTARRLDAARAAIQPDIGASTYTISKEAIAAMPGGDNTELNQVILQSPGVSQDSFGQLHIRDDHNNIQFRLNGVILPEGISVFGQSLSPRLIESDELITGGG